MWKFFVLVAAAIGSLQIALAAPVSLVMPTTILQGEPLRVTTTGSPFLKEVIFDGKSTPIFFYNGRMRAFIGIDLGKKPGQYEIKATLTDGSILRKTVTVIQRKKPIVESVKVPEKLGGASTSSQANLIASISQEDSDIKKLVTGSQALWTKRAFIPPLASMTVTNPYGYGVSTGAYVLSHKGTDLKAKIGTNVFAMNRGVVKIARDYRAYGKTVVIDHGMGLQTLYLHLSEIKVKEGETVERGRIIALSGDTGYVTGPHLHVSIRIGGSSIDPMKFLKLFYP